MQEIILKIRYFERGLSKCLKKVNFIGFFLTQSLLLDKIMKKGPGTSDQLFFRSKNKFKKKIY